MKRFKLPCGCEPGYYLCREAGKLWAEVNRAYDTEDDKAYVRARRKYEIHLKGHLAEIVEKPIG